MNKISYILLSTTLLMSCGNNKKAQTKEPMTVRVATAESGKEESRREFPFISKPYNETDLSFRVGGPVIRFDSQSGQSYKKGEVIAEIDSRDFIIRKERYQAVYRQAEAEYKRIAALYANDNISGSSYEKAKTDLAIAKATFETSVNELNDARLLAPFDGYVQKLYIEPFQDVRASQPVVSFIELNRLKIEAYIPEKLAISLRNANAPVNMAITFDALPGQIFNTTQIDISKTATNNNLSFLLTATLSNPTGELLGGMTGSLSFEQPDNNTSEVVRIPQSALCHDTQKGDYVWIVNVENGLVRAVPVKTGNLTNGKIEIPDGLKAGDTVVLTRHSFLSDNDRVTIQQ